ncbi:MAG: SDR family NAD(P)-dependent oxidoreductase, partial [Candidatus Aminicenantes bacterium]
IFMFPGQGSQYVNMGLELYKTEPAFRQEMDRCFEILDPVLGYKIKEILYPGDSVSELSAENTYMSYSPHMSNKSHMSHLNQTEIAQPMIFSIQYALAKLLIKWGIKPYAMVGHSIGEYVAAHLSGVFTLENALKLVAWRGQLMQQMPPGSMLSVPLPEEELKPLINENKDLSIAAVNSSSRCVVSGPHQSIESFEKILKEKGYETRRLHTSHAFHSDMMDPILAEFEKRVKQIQFKLNKLQIPYISNVTGDWASAENAADPAYWAAHLRKTVRFAHGITKLLKPENANEVFVEIGPGNVLSTFVKQHRDYDKKQGPPIINLIRHPQENVSDHHFLLNQIGKLWIYGKKPDWGAFYSDEKRHRIPLPTYPFDRQRYWIDENPFKTAGDMFSSTSPAKKTNIAEWFYSPSWKQSLPSNRKCDQVPGPSHWLVFIDDCDVGSKLVKQLKQKESNVIIVRPGKTFKKEESRTYLLNPGVGSHYHDLFTHLQEKKMLPHTIVHLWSVSKGYLEPDGGGFENAQARGFYSLVYIAQAIARQAINHKIQIKVVTTNVQEVTGEEELNPEKATVLGPLKVIPQEYPHINCSCIDIVLPKPGKGKDNRLIHQLQKELTIATPGQVIAFRGPHRWVQSFEPLHLAPPTEMSSRLRKKGVYLVTGGLGNIGLLLAEHLVRSAAAKLVLVGRSAFPSREKWEEWLAAHDEKDNLSRKIKKIQELEKLGGQVLVLCADVANREQMQEVIKQAELRFGSINGVIHAAGIISGESVFLSIEQLDTKHCEKQFQPKIHGLWVLENLLKGKKLDFCILMSSLSTVLGGLGYTAYSTANIFMDAFVLYMHKRGIRSWTSVNWDAWRFTRFTGEKAGEASSPLEKLAIKPEQGIKAFQYIFSLDEEEVSRLVISTGHLQTRIDKWIKGEALKEPGTQKKGETAPHQRVGLTGSYEAPKNEIEQKIADIWQDILGIAPVGTRDDFFQLGGDSLLAVQTVSRLNKAFQAKLSAHTLLRETTIERLAQLLASGQAPKSSLLVEIQAGSSRKKPFFLVHPIGGHVYIYRDLAGVLGADQPVYGLQAQGLDGKAQPIASIQEMAAKYIEEMRKVQAEGPYYLGGSCFGGMVAFEMAQQLHVMEQEAALLFMLDTPGPGHMPPPFKDDAAILAFMLNPGDKNLEVSARQIREMKPGDLPKFISEHGGAVEEGSVDAAMDQGRLLLHVFRVHANAMVSYVPRNYAGRIIFFRPTTDGPINPKNPELAWVDKAAQGIEVHDVQGDHITMNDFPNVKVVAEVLKKRLADQRTGD